MKRVERPRTTRLLELLDALGVVAVHLATGAWEWASADALATLGIAAGAEHAWLFEHRSDDRGAHAGAFRAWSTEPRDEQPQAVHRLPERWLDLMRGGEVQVRGAGSSSWYGDRMLERIGQDLSIVVPIVVEARPWGFLALGGLPPGVEWTAEEAAALRAAASVMAGAISREPRERVLGEADERYQALIEEIPAITYIDRPDPSSPTAYRPVFFSPQSTDMLGYSPRELVERPELWIELLHEDDREAALAADAAHHATGEPLSQEYRLVAKDGRTVWVRDQSRMVRDERGEPKFAHGVLLDVTEHKLAETKLRHAMTELAVTDAQRRALLGRLGSVAEEERARIARDIHDDTVQHLAYVSMTLEVLRTRVDGADAQADIDRLAEAVQSAIDSLRTSLSELRAPLLDADDLEVAVRAMMDHISAETNLHTSLRADELTGDPPVEVATILYRIVQEAMMNARKHADASHVRVVLATAQGGASVTVTDNGSGFDTAENGRPEHLGLAAMRERAELAGGWFELESVVDGGTTVRAWLPILGPDSQGALPHRS